ncbi:MerR family transcriptional regulator [Cytobacillus purgationiresistens]|uniref:DNA-binding transcriptional MerR regulator n=1 Tax=Cytobacillus purgationiresistens TaxID=863449 RepID=A0ABU0AN84_9BACI|nr:MerR family transcriptional regulator [Cytobacillus purgationiresistens]MDQ0272650.1 DNA-binding transcriptional MerR regulator [Cytobacillus purgationiresistens]
MLIRPIDIAKKLNISTSSLRHYETWGIVPLPERMPNGYRIYTEEHVAYFECIRAMFPGFGVPLTSKVMKFLQNKELDAALWLVNQAQADLHRDKMMAEKTIKILENDALEEIDSRGKPRWMTIGEVSKAAAVPSSAIRHWEKEGLFSPDRDLENGYRKYKRSHVRQIMIIRTLRTAVYSLDIIKEIIHELDHNNIEHAREIARDSISYLNKINQNQLKGTHYLFTLSSMLGLVESND